MRKLLSSIVMALMLSVACYASVNVSIPTFTVNLNGAQVTSQTREYPLIVYNDITYFPMTYHDSLYLGLVPEWDNATSTFSVSKSNASGEYYSYATSTVNKKNDKAEICAFNVVVNGKSINNKTEQYPLLVYRNVTYFPLTWRFAVDEFGWNYSFTTENGLVINSSGTSIPVMPAPSNPAEDYIDEIENNPSVTNNYWNIWNDALALKSSGDYRGAIDKILSISSVFIKSNMNATASNAMLFKHLGECHSELGEFALASACFAREAYYWDMTAGMEQSQIDADRRARLIKPYTNIYALSDNNSKYFGVKYEPVGGIYIGAIDEMQGLLEKPVAAILEYINYGSDNPYTVRDDQILQLSLQPNSGLDKVNDTDGYLINLAKSLENSGYKVILRFAGEMNDSSTRWPSTPEEYIKKFRIVANVFHKYAPSVPVIWAPNFYPTNNIEAYYPGDEYVDYVGLSLYQEYQPETDPLGRGVDRSRWIDSLDFIYTTYGDRKPIIIVEGGVAYKNGRTTKDLTDYAASHIKEFFTYLPIKYPNVKMFFMFNVNDGQGREFSLYNNKPLLDAYNSVLQSKYYYGSTNYTPNEGSYYELTNMSKVKAANTEICSYTYTPENNVAYVKYYVNGTDAATSYGIPYRVNIDFSQYSGKTITLTVKAFNSEYKVVSETSTYVTVE